MKNFKLENMKTLSKIDQKSIHGGRIPITDDFCMERCLRSNSPDAVCYQLCGLGPAPGR